MLKLILNFGCITLAAFAAGVHFGSVLAGFGVWGALYILAPYEPKS